MGLLRSADTLITVTPVLDTSAYGSGEVLFVATEIPGVGRTAGGAVKLANIHVTDQDDQRLIIDLFFFDRTVTIGTINGALAISDGDGAYYMGHQRIAVADYADLGGVSVASPTFTEKLMQPSATSLFVAAVTGGTPTHTAAGLIFKFGFKR